MERIKWLALLIGLGLGIGGGVGYSQTPVVRAPGGTGSGTCEPSYTSGTVINLAACTTGIGNMAIATIAACSTAAVPSGTGTLFVYIQDDNIGILGYSGTNTTGCGAWVIEQNVTGFPDTSLPIATFTWTGGAWSSTVVDNRRLIRRDVYSFSTGLSEVTTLGGTSVTNDNPPAVAQAGTVRKVADTSSSTTTYTGCPTPTLGTLSAGMFVWFKPNNNNTASSSLNLCGLGATTIQKLSSGTLTNLAAGDLDSDTYSLLSYNGTVFVKVPMEGSGGGTDRISICMNETDAWNPAASSTYYQGAYLTPQATNNNLVRFISPVNGNIVGVTAYAYISTALATGTSGTVITVQKNGSDTAVAATVDLSTHTNAASGTGSTSVSKNDLLNYEIVTPAFTSDPVGVRFRYCTIIEVTSI